MLVLTLKEGDKIRIGEGLGLVIVKYSKRPDQGDTRIRLAFDAPPDVDVVREDVWKRSGGRRRREKP